MVWMLARFEPGTSWHGCRSRAPALRRILHRHRDDGSRVHVDPVLGLVGQVRPTVLHLRDLRGRVLRRFTLAC